MKEREKCKKQAITNLNKPNGSGNFLFQSQEFGQDGHRHSVGFSASFSIKYDITDAILQDNEKMKVQYLRSLLFNFFATLQAVRTWQRNFAAMTTRIKLSSIIEKTKGQLFKQK